VSITAINKKTTVQFWKEKKVIVKGRSLARLEIVFQVKVKTWSPLKKHHRGEVKKLAKKTRPAG